MPKNCQFSFQGQAEAWSFEANAKAIYHPDAKVTEIGIEAAAWSRWLGPYITVFQFHRWERRLLCCPRCRRLLWSTSCHLALQQTRDWQPVGDLHAVAVWLSSSINEIVPHRARLVHRWVTFRPYMPTMYGVFDITRAANVIILNCFCIICKKHRGHAVYSVCNKYSLNCS